jgi:hypothetical protein
MAASITFHANIPNQAVSGDGTLIDHTASSGLGFFGDLFGLSVPVGEYQNTTYVTNSNGTTSGVKVNNTKYSTASQVAHNGAAGIDLITMPNYYAPLNVRFSNDDPVKVQNCKLKIFDRVDPANPATGVTTEVWECRHPHPTEGNDGTNIGTLSLRGTGVTDWYSFQPTDGSDRELPLTPSPGMSGLNTSTESTLTASYLTGQNFLTEDGTNHSSTRHDWFIALSASPDSIGSKTEYGLYITLEYL